MTLAELNTLDRNEAFRELLRCCGSTRWARAMAASRPFGTFEDVVERSDAICGNLDRDDWLEAFAAHPRIGDRAAGSPWSAEEQSGVHEDGRTRLQRLNAEYEQRFGYIFIICATGRSSDEMLHALERRMRNNPLEELKEAADEQRQITRLRLAKLLS
jgi:OHCU decarboxylase